MKKVSLFFCLQKKSKMFSRSHNNKCELQCEFATLYMFMTWLRCGIERDTPSSCRQTASSWLCSRSVTTDLLHCETDHGSGRQGSGRTAVLGRLSRCFQYEVGAILQILDQLLSSAPVNVRGLEVRFRTLQRTLQLGNF